ncbi:MAG: UbiA family prenyltransferase [Thermoplasmata archaeon]|nr:UbiA family prenyltransferase [Thermoplasmata archaeon]
MIGTAPSPRGPAQELGKFLEIQNLGLNLPFALAFLLVAADGRPSLVTVALIVIAFVAARNAGHTFNRWADRRYDAANPRTQQRALVTGRYSPSFALGLTAANAAVLLVAAYFLNFVAFALAPVALALLLGYSYTKRYSAGTTVFLGLVEAITPAAAYIAVTATLPLPAWAAVGGMLLWGTAFETIHSLGDVGADRSLGLKSIPTKLGTPASVRLVPALHAAALGLFGVFGLLTHLGVVFDGALVTMAVVAGWADWRVAARPAEPKVPFTIHFALAALFLAGVLLALYAPGIVG